jgi:RNA polymerase sigma factor (TIGR02999 family)
MHDERTPQAPSDPQGAAFVDAYAELRRIAGALMRNERPGHLLQPTALVNEAYLRLPANVRDGVVERSHLIGRLVVQMKWALLDHAREADAEKRPDPRLRVTLDAQLPAAEEHLVDLLDLCRALAELERLDARHCRVFELRYFGGFDVEECAHLLEVSARTVKYDWQFATAWIAQRLGREPAP